jgi:hypothetical protein
MIARLGNAVVNDQCRRGPRKDDAPAPNETGSSVAHKANLCKQFCQRAFGGSIRGLQVGPRQCALRRSRGGGTVRIRKLGWGGLATVMWVALLGALASDSIRPFVLGERDSVMKRRLTESSGSRRGSLPGAARGVVLLAALAAMLVLAPGALAAGDANQASCPNEAMSGFRAYLPDCRAYELVSPPYKQGYQMSFEGSAPDGSRVVGASLGDLSGAKGASQTRNDLGDLYEMVRSSDGWQTVPLTPENPEYRSAVSFKGVSANAGAELFSMPSAPAGQDNFYVVRNSGTSVTDLGPATPPSDGPASEPGPGPTQEPGLEGGAAISFFTPVGTTPSMTHIVFKLHAPFGWEGDTTQRGYDNLYEYAEGTGGPPAMVAVEGSRDSTTLIGECGETLGGPTDTTSFGAFSESGEITFFTPVAQDEGGVYACGLKQPQHAQLYARVAQSKTVQVSAPQCSPEWCEATPESDAVFSGASRSGEKAFFLSTQRLNGSATEDATTTDSADEMAGSGCERAEGTGCNLYEYNLSDKALTTISAGVGAPHVQGVVRVAAGGSRVYFVATGKLTAEPNSEGHAPEEKMDNLYVYENLGGGAPTTIRFIATLSPEDEALWGRDSGEDVGRPVSTTPDGEFLVFESRADLTSDDTSSGVDQLFEYQAGAANTLKRVSVGNEGFNDDGNTTTFGAAIPTAEYTEDRWYYPQPIVVSNNGQVVVFESEDALVKGAGDSEAGRTNIYEYDAGHVALIYGEAGVRSGLYGMDEDGENIFFKTQASLVPEDTDTQTDIYDAREDGGRPAAGPVACAGEACQGEGSPALAPALPGSTVLSGDGNLAPSVPVAVKPKPKAKALTKAQKLSKALRACEKKKKKQRAACEQQAKKRYGRSK